jgi:hypothetical protein
VSRRPTDTKKKEAVDVYAFAYCRDRRRASLTKVEYEKIARDHGRYDFFIDGIAHRCFNPDRRGDKQLTKRLSAAEFQMIREFVVQGGVHSPRDFYRGKARLARSIMRQFEFARQKVDLKRPDGSFTLLRTYKGAAAEERSFEFAPPADVSWLLLELKRS